MSVYEITVRLPDSSIAKLREEIDKRKQLDSILRTLRDDAMRIESELVQAIEVSRTGIEALGQCGVGDSYLEHLDSYLDEMDPKAAFTNEVDEMIGYGFVGKVSQEFDGHVYNFVDEMIDTPASFESEQFPRVAVCNSLSLMEYHLPSAQALMHAWLRYDDEPRAEIEYAIMFRLDLSSEQPSTTQTVEAKLDSR